ncbi:DUF4311 domain-containing protein [Lactiplantibacillus daowaiensis]|uniref:DUF4311 domain-containing protein n=1 Tax=Lactiplantibacillus daowaiensis TaxID=2559918 RepID=A0ABW1S2K1_9LACO
MHILVVLIESIIIGGLVGFAAGVGAARMFNAPTVQALGAFRTLGEMNAAEGDAASHFSFGLGFFFNAWASTVGAGAFTQDVTHRVIPNWAVSALLMRNKDINQTMHNPKKMGYTSAVIGIAVVAFLNVTSSSIPAALQVTAVKVLVPAATLLINMVMPIIFWLAAIDAGRRSGLLGTIFGGLAALIMGNAVPGVVLGILIGKGVEEIGWTRITRIMLAAVILLFILSAFFRGFDVDLLKSFKLGVPTWLTSLHNSMGG